MTLTARDYETQQVKEAQRAAIANGLDPREAAAMYGSDVRHLITSGRPEHHGRIRLYARIAFRLATAALGPDVTVRHEDGYWSVYVNGTRTIDRETSTVALNVADCLRHPYAGIGTESREVADAILAWMNGR